MKRGPKFEPVLTVEQVREIFNAELPEKYKRTKEFYESIADKYNVKPKFIQHLLSDKDNRTKQLYWRYQLKKEVTTKHAVNIITDMYKEIYNKEPDDVKAVLRYEVLQMYIKPENIILQFDEMLLVKLNTFVNTAYKALYNHDKVQEYLKKNKKTI